MQYHILQVHGYLALKCASIRPAQNLSPGACERPGILAEPGLPLVVLHGAHDAILKEL